MKKKLYGDESLEREKKNFLIGMSSNIDSESCVQDSKTFSLWGENSGVAGGLN